MSAAAFYDHPHVALLDAVDEVLNYIGDGVLANFPIGEMSEEDSAEVPLGFESED